MSLQEKLKELELLKQLHKVKARKELINFITYNDENSHEAKRQLQWFHKIMCQYAEKLARREIKKLMFFVPPQHLKSTIASINLPAYMLGLNPNEKIIIGSYNKSKATDFVKQAKRIIKSNSYKELFPQTEVKGSDTDDYFEINDGKGFVKSAGMDSGVTGFPCSVLLIDDPIKGRNQANSPTIRNKTWNTFIDDFKTRQDNDSVTMLTFTRWSIDDFGGRLLDPENEYYNEEEAKEWTVLIFQALKENELPYKNAVKYNDPRQIDEALWETKHSAKKYFKRRESNLMSFNSLDQQRPNIEEGNKIKKEWWVIKNESELPFNINSVTADFFIDGAFTDKTQNDPTALMSCYHHKQNDTLYIFNCTEIRKELYELLAYFKEYAKQNYYKPQSSVFIELKASGHPLKSMLRQIEHGGFNTREINNKTVSLGKFNRVENAEPFIASGKVILVKGAWNIPFIEQCASFPNGTHDDMIDDVCYAIDKYFISNKAKKSIKYEN